MRTRPRLPAADYRRDSLKGLSAAVVVRPRTEDTSDSMAELLNKVNRRASENRM